MNDKPTNFDDVQLNDAELDQVVGGQEVLSLQMMDSNSGLKADGCGNSSVSCVSNVSCVSTASGGAAETKL
ncbi:MAG: hypothetical protein EOO71_17640 [Myxococcaceae bacterium]|nr:MAG: hypothetical protein EOO71_17640 [Myxococcaceae bacterium]